MAEEKTSIAIIGAGVIGLRAAVELSKNPQYKITIFSKELPTATNSAKAVAVWFPAEKKHLSSTIDLSTLCEKSLDEFAKLSLNPKTGVQRIPMIYYFEKKEDFDKSPFADVGLQKLIDFSYELPQDYQRINHDYFAFFARPYLINPSFYIEYLLKELEEAGVVFEYKMINLLDELTPHFDAILVCAGWESSRFCDKSSPMSTPIRGQTLTGKLNDIPDTFNQYSVNIVNQEGKFYYFTPRKASGDFIIGTTYQPLDNDLKSRPKDSEDIKGVLSKFIPNELLSVELVSNVGIRAGCTKGVQFQKPLIKGKTVIINFGHGGNGFSASPANAVHLANLCEESLKLDNTVSLENILKP